MLELALHEEPAYLLVHFLFPPTKHKYTSLFLIARRLSSIVLALRRWNLGARGRASLRRLVRYCRRFATQGRWSRKDADPEMEVQGG